MMVKLKLTLGCVVCISFAQICHASLVLNAIGETKTIDFDISTSDVNEGAFAGGGFKPNPDDGQLDSDAWAVTGWSDGFLSFGGVKDADDFARGASSGGVTTGGIYAFDVGGGDIALGFQPGGSDWTPGTLTLRVQNNTGQIITSLGLAYTVYIRNDQNRANSFNSSWSIDDNNYTDIAALDLTSIEAEDSTASFVAYGRSTILTGLSIADSDFFYLRWTGDDVSGSGSRDEFALDDISITPVPEPTAVVAGVLLLLPLGAQGFHSWRRHKETL